VEAVIGSTSNLSLSVILNLFQDPFCLKHIACRREADRAICANPAAAGQTEQWVLKQVQDDENLQGTLLQ